VIEVKDSELLRCPICQKAITPHEVTILSSSEDSFFNLQPLAQGHCAACGHRWDVHDSFFLDRNGKITIGRSH
jgi:uncharacterized Zn finger protein